MWNTFTLEEIMKHSEPAPLQKNTGIKARGKGEAQGTVTRGQPCPGQDGTLSALIHFC